MPGDPVAGAVNAIVADPRRAGRLPVATVNGGIWMTANATSANPRWRPLTDRLPALSISAPAMSPAGPQLIFGGTGSTSSFARAGGPGFGDGCDPYVASPVRLDAARAPAGRWQNAVCAGANGTAPDADSRAMLFDADGDLLQASNGGIYRLLAPNQASRRLGAGARQPGRPPRPRRRPTVSG